MANNLFPNHDMLQQWVEAAEGIKKDFGAEKAFSYLLGEKFYNLLKDLKLSQGAVRGIEQKRNQIGYKPIKSDGYYTINLDDEYQRYQDKICALQDALSEFSTLIRSAFGLHEINAYFGSHPRFGALGHICTEEDHKEFIGHGAVEHSIETEIDDALLLGEMQGYFGLDLR